MSSLGSYQSSGQMMLWNDELAQESWDHRVPISSSVPHDVLFMTGLSTGEVPRYVEPLYGSKAELPNQGYWTNLLSSERNYGYSLNMTPYAWYPSDKIEACFAGNMSSSRIHSLPVGIATPVLPSNDPQGNQWPVMKNHLSRTASRVDIASSSRSYSPLVRSGQQCASSRVSKPKRSAAVKTFQNKTLALVEDRLPIQSDHSTIMTKHHTLQLQWGSDSAFGGITYIPPKNQPSQPDAIGTWLNWIESIAPSQEIQWSSRTKKQQGRLTEFDNGGYDHYDTENGENAAPKRGWRTRLLSPAEEARLRAARRKEIHNNSERKRREQMNKGFHDLCDIIPHLDTCTHTRKEILFHTAIWLEQLLQDNACLKDQLAQLTTRNSTT